MDLTVEKTGKPIVEKLVLATSGILALTLGMSAGTARADLIVTQFNSTGPMDPGAVVTFGPDGGFAASYSQFGLFKTFSLSGNGLNQVAVTTPDCGDNCTLEPSDPGTLVDGTLNFASSGDYKTSY